MVATPEANPMLPRPYRVVEVHPEAADSVTLSLVAAHGDGESSFEPGQFTMLYVLGVGEVPIAISGDPGQSRVRQHTVRRVGAVTNALCDLEVDSEIGVRGPFGTSWPTGRVEEYDILIIAGGIGLAPLRPAVFDVLANRNRFGSVSVLYGVGTPEDLLFEEDLHSWRGRFDLEVEVTVDRSSRAWRGDVGVVTTLLPRVSFDPSKTIALVCGPEIMMKVVARELSALGVSSEDIFVSIERNMKCAIGFCGHCQFGADFICRDGPVVSYATVAARLRVPEL
jgi:NAD(P)H-flavin reductase